MTLTMDRICKSYGSTKALCDFSATLEPGICALLGPNGSGKSTLMDIITDNLRADSGEITYSGDDGIKENVIDMGVRFREKLGFMPQYPGLYPNFTLEQFLEYMAVLKDVGAEFKGKEKKEYIRARTEEVLRAVELDDVGDHRIKTLSGGMKQRLALAQAVLGDSEILILDEPTAGLDPKQRITIRNYISEIALDRIVLIATHVVSDVEFIASKIIMLKKGVVVDDDVPEKLLDNINDKVWTVSCPENLIHEYQEKSRVISISRSDKPDIVSLRVLSDGCPGEGAFNVSPSLEDYYMYVFGETGSVG